MTLFELVALTAERAVYDYYPDGDKSDRGQLSFNRLDGTWIVLERAEADCHSFYSNHLGYRLEEFNRSGFFQKSGFAAWC